MKLNDVLKKTKGMQRSNIGQGVVLDTNGQKIQKIKSLEDRLRKSLFERNRPRLPKSGTRGNWADGKG